MHLHNEAIPVQPFYTNHRFAVQIHFIFVCSLRLCYLPIAFVFAFFLEGFIASEIGLNVGLISQ